MTKTDSSKAVERTLLNWQRTALSMFVVSALSIKIALVNEQRILLLLITLLALFGSAALLLLRFTKRTNSAIYTPIMLIMSVLIVVLLGVVCTLSFLLN